MISQRYFRAPESVYESVRLTLDAAWSHGPASGTETCYEPAATAPRDGSGHLLLAVRSTFCSYPEVSSVLPGLLASGDVEELTAEQYEALLPLPGQP